MLVGEAVQKYRDYITAPVADNAGLPTGLDAWDAKTGGLRPGEVTTIAARTSVGKTVVMQHLIASVCDRLVATEDPRKVVFISAELPARTLVQRWLSSLLRVNSGELRYLSGTARGDMEDQLERISQWPLVVWDARGPEIGALKRDLWELTGHWKPGDAPQLALVAVDHIGEVVADGYPDLYQRTSKVAEELFKVASYYDVAVLQAAQINRSVEGRAFKRADGSLDVSGTRPMPSDIEGSGKIEQRSDVVALCWREERYLAMHEGREEQAGPLEINIAKSRGGRTGVVRVPFIPEFTKLDVPLPPPPSKGGSAAARRAALKAGFAATASPLSGVV